MESPRHSIRTVCCINTGTKYGDDYVRKLRNMVERQLSGHDFVCFSDHFIADVKVIKIPDASKSWWDKMALFAPDLSIRYPALYFDLDVLIAGDLTELAVDQPFAIIKQWKNITSAKTWPAYNSSVMYWREPPSGKVWAKWIVDPEKWIEEFRGDQDFLAYATDGHCYTWPSGWFAPMEDCLDGCPDNAKVIICNTLENHIAAERAPWVKTVWK